MFLFESFSFGTGIMWLGVLAALMLLNELARAHKIMPLIMFVVVPIILTIFVWPKTAGEGSSTGTWFHWVKVYSALAGCIGFYLIATVKGWSTNKFALMFPPFILALNILEACVRDFQVYGFQQGMVDGVMMVPGPWNIMNGIAGLLNIIAISGWVGIRFSKDHHKHMVWPDMLWFWIIPYDLWNFAYVYNCVGDHAFYAGAALLIAPTLAAFLFKRGTWLQARAQTLAFWMMFTMAYPTFVSSSKFAVESSHNPTALFIVSFLALSTNVALVGYHFYKVFKYKKNVFKDEIHSDLSSYKDVVVRDEADAKRYKKKHATA